MDREKVIKGITHHKLGMCDMSGKICPYWNEDDGCSKKMLEDVLSLLKEQEAVEARKKNDGKPQPWTSWWYICGACGQEIEYHDRFCRWCGRSVKWE